MLFRSFGLLLVLQRLFRYLLCFFWVFMVGSSEVRIACPSISFLFACLGGVFRCFSARQEFFFEGNSLGVVLTELCPLLHQSLDWFKGLGEGERDYV